MTFMHHITKAFSRGNHRTVDAAHDPIVTVLNEAGDATLVHKFTQLMHLWRTDKSAEGKAKRRPSQELKSLFRPEVAELPKLDPALKGSGRRPIMAFTHTKYTAPPPQPAIHKVPILTKSHIDHATAAGARPSARRAGHRPWTNRHAQPRALSGGSHNTPHQHPHQQQPCEANDFGVDTHDGVLVGYPPEYPPALLDWDTEGDEDMDEVVSNRRTRSLTITTSAAPRDGRGRPAGQSNGRRSAQRAASESKSPEAAHRSRSSSDWELV